MSADATRILGLVPEEIETIIAVQCEPVARMAVGERRVVDTMVVDGKHISVTTDEKGNAVEPPVGMFQNRSLAWNVDLLQSIDYGRFSSTWIRPEKVAMTVSGACNFSEQENGQQSVYDGCVFILFSDAVVPNVIADLRMRVDAERNVRAAYPIVLSTKQPWRAGELKLYISHIGDRLLIAATDLELMRRIMALQDAQGREPWILKTPEWKYVDARAPIWAIRHYRSESRRGSRTSLLRVDERAVGVAVNYCAVQNGGSVTARYICSNAASRKAILGFYPRDVGITARVSAQDRGGINVAFDIGTSDDHWVSFLGMVGPLGYEDIYMSR